MNSLFFLRWVIDEFCPRETKVKYYSRFIVCLYELKYYLSVRLFRSEVAWTVIFCRPNLDLHRKLQIYFFFNINTLNPTLPFYSFCSKTLCLIRVCRNKHNDSTLADQTSVIIYRVIAFYKLIARVRNVLSHISITCSILGRI